MSYGETDQPAVPEFSRDKLMNLFFICRIIWALNFYFSITVCSLKSSTLFLCVDSASSGEK